MARRERWASGLRLAYSKGGYPICYKHDFIESNCDDPEMTYEIAEAARAAREDGIAMERALKERKEIIESMQSEIDGLQEEIRELQYRLAHPDSVEVDA